MTYNKIIKNMENSFVVKYLWLLKKKHENLRK